MGQKLNQKIICILYPTAQGDLPDVSMVEEDFNVREETININDTQIEETIDIDSEHTIELSDSDNEIDCEVVNQINESTINITDEDSVKNVSNMESDEDENSNSNNISSSQYFAECPVHNHHTDNDSICPDEYCQVWSLTQHSLGLSYLDAVFTFHSGHSSDKLHIYWDNQCFI